MKRSPSALSAELLRKQGCIVDTVERWIPGVNIRRDLFGIADLFAVHTGGVILVQATSLANMAARRTKIEASKFIGDLLRAGITVEVHGWDKSCKRCSVSKLFMKDGVATWETEDA